MADKTVWCCKADIRSNETGTKNQEPWYHDPQGCSHSVKHKVIAQSSNWRNSNSHLNVYIHSSIVYKSQNLKITRVCQQKHNATWLPQWSVTRPLKGTEFWHATAHMDPENTLNAVSGKRQSSVILLMKLIRWTNSFISRTDYESYERSCSY